MTKLITSDDTQLSELIGRIYQVATDPGGIDGLAKTIASAFDSELVFFCRNTPSTESRMPTLSGFITATDNNDGRNEWHVGGGKDELRTEWSDYLSATGILHLLGAQFIVVGNLMSVVGIHRPPGREPFDEFDRQKMNLLCPHIQRALQLRESLSMSEQRTALSLDVLNGLEVGVVLLAADCRILFANKVAESALREKCSPLVCDARLRPLDFSEAFEFELMVSEVAKTSAGLGTNSGGIFYLTLSATAKFPVLVSPIKSGTVSFSTVAPAAIVVCSNPHATINIAEQMLARRFDLTHAEARLYAALIAGHEIVDYAEQQKVSVGTVKTHLKSIFDKTGCHRQVDLVRIALTDPVLRL